MEPHGFHELDAEPQHEQVDAHHADFDKPAARGAGVAFEHHRNDGDADMQPLAIANAAARNENQIIASTASGSGQDEALLST